MNDIDLTELFQTKDALIEKLKEELQQANEDAERLYKSLYHLIFVADYDKTCSRCRDIKNNLKAHEERIA